jgi:hypothetical protein
MKPTPLTWTALNNALRGLTRERDVLALFRAQRAAGANNVWLRRIWGRYNKLRKARELEEMVR